MSMEQIYNDIKSKILSIRNDIAVGVGSASSDTFITPTSYIVNKNRVELTYAEALQTLFTLQLLLNSDAALQEIATVELKSIDDVKSDISAYLDKFVNNFGISRFAATYATGNIDCGRTELLDNDKTITAGTVIKTLQNKEYTVTTTTTMVAPGSIYYDADYRRYLIAVPVTANETGTIGNTVSGTITQFVNTPNGITYVTNIDSITNGQDEETDAQLIARTQTILSGNNFGTKDGYKNLVMNNFRDVQDVMVTCPGDTLMLRDNGSGGMVDIWVLCENVSETITETFSGFDFVVDVPNYQARKLNFTPVDNLQIITAPATGVLVKDVSELSGSYAENSYVYFPTAPTGSYDISYYYYKIVGQIQSLLQLAANAILGNTIKVENAVENIALVRLAIKKLVNISFTISILTGYDSATVISAVEDNVNNYVATLVLGDNLAQSDIVGVVEDTVGVDFVTIPMSNFNFVNATDSLAQINDLVVADNEFIRIFTLNVSE